MPDLTETVDPLLANYQSSTLILWITLVVILVALIALGTEFWVNLWGMLWYPSLTFQRMLGESQAIPGIVVTAIAGMASGLILNAYVAKAEVVNSILDFLELGFMSTALEQLDNLLDQVGSDLSILSKIDQLSEYGFQAQSIALAVPIGFLILWVLWGLAGQLGSMIAGNKAGHGLSNLLSALPYTFLVAILSTWFLMWSITGSGFAKILLYLSWLYFLFVHVAMMREHGRYNISKAIIASILTLILTIVFVVVVVILIAFIWAQAANYL